MYNKDTYFLCVLATCLVFANGGVLHNRGERREDPEECVSRVLGQCTPAHIPHTPDELFDKSGHFLLNCSEETLVEEQHCADLLGDCHSFQSISFGIMMVVKRHICAKPHVYKSGGACWNEMQAPELEACNQCADWTCYRPHLDMNTCTDEQLKFMANLNRAVVMLLGHC